VRAGDLDDLGAELLQQRDRLAEARLDAGLVALAAELLDHADAHAADVGSTRRLDHRRHRRVDGGRVERVVAADRLVQERGVEDRTGTRAALVERRGERHEAVAGDASVGGLHADGPVTDAGWRIDPPVSVPIASAAMNEEIAAEDPPPDPPGMRLRSHGVVRRAVRAVSSRSPHSTLHFVFAYYLHSSTLLFFYFSIPSFLTIYNSIIFFLLYLSYYNIPPLSPSLFFLLSSLYTSLFFPSFYLKILYLLIYILFLIYSSLTSYQSLPSQFSSYSFILFYLSILLTLPLLILSVKILLIFFFHSITI
jgi:hypothetical protein